MYDSANLAEIAVKKESIEVIRFFCVNIILIIWGERERERERTGHHQDKTSPFISVYGLIITCLGRRF